MSDNVLFTYFRVGRWRMYATCHLDLLTDGPDSGVKCVWLGSRPADFCGAPLGEIERSDLRRGLREFLAEAARLKGRPVRTVTLTTSDEPAVIDATCGMLARIEAAAPLVAH